MLLLSSNGGSYNNDQPDNARASEGRVLVEACGRGDADAMLKLSERFAAVGRQSAAKMWLIRSAIYGNPKAQNRVLEELRRDPTFFNTCSIQYEKFIPGNKWWVNSFLRDSGDGFNDLGLLAFQPDEWYIVSGLREERYILAGQYASRVDADEDGFGRVDYFHMFCLDEFFQPFPNAPMTGIMTLRDTADTNECDEILNHAFSELEKRNLPTLWTDFLQYTKD